MVRIIKHVLEAVATLPTGAAHVGLVARDLSTRAARRTKLSSARRIVGRKPLAERDLIWVFGSGRSGSTWLLEMLRDLGHHTWNEPYFGLMLLYPKQDPESVERPGNFFSDETRRAWLPHLGTLFLKLVRQRYGLAKRGQKLFLKDINAFHLCPYFEEVFPHSKYVLLVRDPYDVFDSQIDMQRKGAWNEGFSETVGLTQALAIRKTAEHIAESYAFSLQGYEARPNAMRIRLRYGDLLNDPHGELRRLLAFAGANASESRIQAVVEAHRFAKYEKTGRDEFRRFGEAGHWRRSENFTPEVRQIAEEVLGELRQRLGYAQDAP